MTLTASRSHPKRGTSLREKHQLQILKGDGEHTKVLTIPSCQCCSEPQNVLRARLLHLNARLRGIFSSNHVVPRSASAMALRFRLATYHHTPSVLTTIKARICAVIQSLIGTRAGMPLPKLLPKLSGHQPPAPEPQQTSKCKRGLHHTACNCASTALQFCKCTLTRHVQTVERKRKKHVTVRQSVVLRKPSNCAILVQRPSTKMPNL